MIFSYLNRPWHRVHRQVVVGHLGDLMPLEAGGLLDRFLQLGLGTAVSDHVEPLAVAAVLGDAPFVRCEEDGTRYGG